MVLSIYDIEDVQQFFDRFPIKRVPSVDLDYDLLAFGKRLGIGFVNGASIVGRPEYELDVKGRIRCTELLMTSDARVKTDIRDKAPVECAEAVARLGTASYRLINDDDRLLRTGFIAQQVEQEVPELVRRDTQGNCSVDTTQIVALLVGAVKYLSTRVDSLEQQLSEYSKQR